MTFSGAILKRFKVAGYTVARYVDETRGYSYAWSDIQCFSVFSFAISRALDRRCVPLFYWPTPVMGGPR